MSVFGHQTPPLFRSGLSVNTKLAVYLVLSLLLLTSDIHFRYLDRLRMGLATAIYPLQLAASMPGKYLDSTSSYFSGLSALQQENIQLKAQTIDSSRRVLLLEQLEKENIRLRELMQMAGRIPAKTIAAEVVFLSPDPFAHRVILGKGNFQGIESGMAVVDMNGVIGQVTRVYPAHAEVTLLPDKNQAIAVMVERSGLRAVMFGAGNGMLELRFLASNADVKEGDRILTSGLGGVFVAGLPVATVTKITKDSRTSFAQVLCTPLGKPDALGAVLVVGRVQKGVHYLGQEAALLNSYVPPPALSDSQSAPVPTPPPPHTTRSHARGHRQTSSATNPQ